MITKLFTQIKKRKFTSGIAFLLIVGIGYWGYGSLFSQDGVVRYASAQVQKGTLIVSLSGTGQVSASNQVDIKPKVAGDVVYVGVKNGQEVKAGALIAQLDAGDAQKAVRDAELNLENARLSLDKFKLDQERQLSTPDKSYEEGMDILTDFYDELPIVLDNLKSIYFQANLSSDRSPDCSIDYFSLNDCDIAYYAHYSENKQKFASIPNQVSKLYREVNDLYSKSKSDYQNVQRSGDSKERLSAIEQGREIAVKTAEMIKIGRDVTSSFHDILLKSGGTFTKQEVVDGHISSLAGYSDTVATYANNLLSAINSINSYAGSIESLPLDLQIQELTVKQRENALLDVKEKLADYYVRAPFDGVIAQTDVKNGDPATTASVLATLITRQKIAEVSLNEVDVAQVKVGQKATLTFDAVPDLTITGQVAEIDAVGTASQGVVTYNIKIGFDTQDERVKTAMSVSAAIITEAKPDVLLVPNSAVKSQGGVSYVEVPDESDISVATINASGAVFQYPIQEQQIEVGTANDEFTEIISGLNEGDLVVTRTIQPTAAAQTQQQSGGLSIPGLGGGGTRTGGGGGFQR